MITVQKSEFKKLYDIACADWKSKLDEAMKGQAFSTDISFEESFVAKMEAACTAGQKPVFEAIFAKHLKTDLFTKIKTIEDVYKELGKKMPTLEDFDFLSLKQATKLLNACHVKHIEELFDFEPNFDNGNQEKWYPYFEKRSGSWMFLVSYCHGSALTSMVWSGFYKDRKTSDFVGKTFIDIYTAII